MGNFQETIADLVRLGVHDDTIRANLLTGGEVFLVLEDSDTDYNKIFQRFGSENVFTTLNEAYEACVTNRNDIILMSAQNTHTVVSIAWTKSRIHVEGLDGGGRYLQQGTKLQTATGTAGAYVIKNTGTRNSFRNIKFIQGSAEATALTVFQFGGEGNMYENCSFVFGVADNLGGTTAHEAVMGEDSGTFKECTFGNDTLVTSGDRAVMLIDEVTTGQEMKSCVFKDCLWSINSSEANANFIKINAAGDCKFTQTFINPIFNAAICAGSGGIALTDAVESVTGLVDGNLLFVSPACNCTNFCATVTDQVQVVGMGDMTTSKVGIAVTPA